MADLLDQAFDDCLNLQDQWYEKGRAEGRAAGREDTEAFDMGVTKGREMAVEVGFTRGCCAAVRSLRNRIGEEKWERVAKVVDAIEDHIAKIDFSDASNPELSVQVDAMRAKYKQLCSNLGLDVGGVADDGDLF